MPNLAILFQDNGTFPANFNGTPADLKDAIIAAMAATVDADSLIFGKVGGTMPTTNIGPWLNGQTWFAWNGTTYSPMLIKVGTSAFQITLTAPATLLANRTVTFQDKDGTIALRSDIYIPRPTKVLTGVNPNIDWSLTNSFFFQAGATTGFPMTNSKPGQEIWVVVKSTGAFAIGFPPYIVWIGGNPTQTTNGTDFYQFRNVAGTAYGRQLPNYA